MDEASKMDELVTSATVVGKEAEQPMISAPDLDPRTNQPFTKNGLRRYMFKERKKAALAVTRLAERHARVKEAIALRSSLHYRVGFPAKGEILLDEYRSIPLVHVPEPAGYDGGSTIMDRIFVRTAAFQQKHGPQEVSLLFQVYCIARSRLSATPPSPLQVLDIGAGNANLSALIALILEVPVVCVEREEHREELEGEKLLPPILREMITRRTSDIRDFELSPEDGVSTIVLGKHLCGLGTDCSIDFIARQKRHDVVGCVFATCCLSKICEDVKLFTELYSLDNAEELIHKLASLTSWRVMPRTESSVILPGMLREAEWAESVFSWFRKRKLERRFTEVHEIIYCDGDLHSLQNRCLVASNPKSGTTLADCVLIAEFHALLEAQITKYADILPMDMTPSYLPPPPL